MESPWGSREKGPRTDQPRKGAPESFILTFDDGPDQGATERVLDALDDAGAPAAFFPITAKLPATKRVIRRIAERGHEVHLHCHDHVSHIAAGRAAVERDTRRALRVLESVGVAPRFWRPPWGIVAPWTHEVAEGHQLELAGWSIDTHDWRGDQAAEMLERAAPRLAPGAVILMHDGLGPGAARRQCGATAELIGPLVARARAGDLVPAPLTSLAGSPALRANLVASPRHRDDLDARGARAS